MHGQMPFQSRGVHERLSTFRTPTRAIHSISSHLHALWHGIQAHPVKTLLAGLGSRHCADRHGCVVFLVVVQHFDHLVTSVFRLGQHGATAGHAIAMQA
jgi:hypothetical protein